MINIKYEYVKIEDLERWAALYEELDIVCDADSMSIVVSDY